jgi:hypothetical protein
MGKTNEIFVGPDLFKDLCQRDLSVGDTLFLREWMGGADFTGRELSLRVEYLKAEKAEGLVL